ncbi:NlpC/P60 family protein [Paenibacillus larvae]|uniref:NlpC/P60 family protein n=2 Tax=Paenibacillus larvae TaxID=1464 RepID=A0AAP5N1W3_9BACL|nr:NlpC/P60 family protein [Paenibacillus larvae]MDE5126531.1 NlpC/P60 family protein [Paenibacillus larvae subsp. larvae]MDE5133639.1 NlpC/P60 family protein [Paenibacillus larvae subsp. larvae]MDE5137677.1 NlpC/P60 family protein [Paenibacillus larvae subsp. larvae]MDE5142267.1 NlpC/P60 family protein [Paenibacillus larvae subsp. larvae]MDE5150046.1 NlpC/P60 family protein [Paenibacillus larvae subsp. larvae]
MSHVGIYVGNGKMYNANNKGVGYTDINRGYWAKHRLTFGRIK